MIKQLCNLLTHCLNLPIATLRTWPISIDIFSVNWIIAWYSHQSWRGKGHPLVAPVYPSWIPHINSETVSKYPSCSDTKLDDNLQTNCSCIYIEFNKLCNNTFFFSIADSLNYYIDLVIQYHHYNYNCEYNCRKQANKLRRCTWDTMITACDKSMHYCVGHIVSEFSTFICSCCLRIPFDYPIERCNK